MTDVRSLLRSERAARRITHPHATYSTTGTLVCLVCHIQLKSESLWDAHLKSAQHAMRLQRIRDGTLGRPPGAPAPMNGTDGNRGSSKKRKADDGDGDTRKRTKAASALPEGFFDGDVKEYRSDLDEEDTPEVQTFPVPQAIMTRGQDEPTIPNKQTLDSGLPAGFFDASAKGAPPTITVDEDEWAAFERDVATPPPGPSATAVLKAAATISAAPLTAAEIAAQSRKEASTQTKEKREAEIEGEKEDAARQLEEEFDEMEELEQRVRRLREKREAIRKGRAEAAVLDGDGEPPDKSVQIDSLMQEKGDDRDDEDDDDDDDEWNHWGF